LLPSQAGLRDQTPAAAVYRLPGRRKRRRRRRKRRRRRECNQLDLTLEE
jgi:hypothetical protein